MAPQHAVTYIYLYFMVMVVKIESYMCTVSFKGDHKIFFGVSERRKDRAYFLVG